MNDDNRRDLTREIEGAVASRDDRVIELSFSSEEPYTRWFGQEILDHSDGCVDLSRLNEIGVVLFNHERGQVLGQILRAWVEDGRGKAEIRFDEDPDADAVYQKVVSGTLKGVSVGYTVSNWETVETGSRSEDGRFAGPVEIARSWMPYEISIVSVPADPTVGVGRQMENPTPEEENHPIITEEVTRTMDENINVQPVVNEAEIAARAMETERQRITEINALCREFDIDSSDYVSNGSTIDQVRAAVLEQLATRQAPISTNVTVTDDEGDKFRRAAADGLVMRSGLSVSAPEAGAESFRGMSLRDLAIDCLTREGHSASSLLHKDSSEIYDMLSRQFYNPTAAFPAILDSTIQKSIVDLYNKVPTTFQEITTKGSLSDFKETSDHEYVIGGVGDFLLVPENGEIKADKPSTSLLPSRKLDTYAKQFSMTRQAFVNDDIGFLTRVPGLYAQAAKKTIDKQVYSILFNNSTIFDGKALFHNDHANLIASGTAPTQAAIQEAILKLQGQTDQFGDAIYMTPAKLVVPVGYEFDLAVIFRSAQVVGSSNNDINPLYNYPLQVVQSPVLNALAGTNACPWFLLADESSARGIQVDYLNGVETPTVRRMEVPGTLGFVWDIWLDWGISVRDWRGLVKNPGTTL